ncbi:hypothetical protein WI76_07055 [Burkholderia ubonensis]|nr:hypothetical protein WI76_07055 [Burkholderia ubonensis]
MHLYNFFQVCITVGYFEYRLKRIGNQFSIESEDVNDVWEVRDCLEHLEDLADFFRCQPVDIIDKNNKPLISVAESMRDLGFKLLNVLRRTPEKFENCSYGLVE